MALYFTRQNLDFRPASLDFTQGGLDFSRAVSISSRSENNKYGAKRGLKAAVARAPESRSKPCLGGPFPK